MQLARFRDVILAQDDHRACCVETAAASATRHLNVFGGQEVPEVGAVVLADRVENDSPCRHVHSHSEGLGRKQELDQSFLK